MNTLETAEESRGSSEKLLFDRIDANATILAISDTEADLLGVAPGSVVGANAGTLYDTASIQRLQRMLLPEEAETGAHGFPVTMLRAGGARIELMAIAVRRVSAGQPVLDIFKAPGLDVESEFRELAESNDIMWAIIQKAREAIWCIRYDQPVDLNGTVDEIVDQIFEHPSVWCMCNTAMAKAYDLKDETDLNARNVRFHWPRNAFNEAFIREVIANGFQVEGAISEDHRRDGTPVLMENDVRAYIADGKLHRLWGTLREVKPTGLGAQGERFDYAALAFEMLPLPACLIRQDGTLITENIAWRLAFGSLGQVTARMAFRSASAGEYREIVLPLPLASGQTRHHLVTIRWQAIAEQAQSSTSAAYLTVTARPIDDAGAAR